MTFLLTSPDDLPQSESSSDRLLSFSSYWLTPDENDELSESINKSFQKNAVVINNKPTSRCSDASSLTLSKICISPRGNSGLQEKAVAKAKSPKIGISRNTTTVLQKKVVRNSESPKINVPSKEPTKVTKRAEVVKSNSSSVITKPSAKTTANLRRSKLSYANLPKYSASSLPNDVPPTAGFDEQPAYDQWSAPCGYAEYNRGIPASFGSDTDVLQRAGSHHCVTQCDSNSEGDGADDFDASSSDVPRWSRRGDGDAANVMPSRKPFERFRADRDAEKHAARKPAVNQPSGDSIEKMKQIINVYVAPVGGSPRPPVRKPCTPVGPLVSSSYINRQKKLKEIESTNMIIAKKVLGAKPTISSFRKY